MVDKVSVNPLSVRGAGDIVSPKTASDFDVYNSTITSNSEDVNGAVMTVYTVSYVNGTYFTVSSGSVVPVSDNTFIVSAVLKLNSDDSVVSGATVTCTVNDDTVLSGTTDSTGTVSFTVDTVSGVGKYIVKLVYAGTESVGGAFRVTRLISVDLDSLSLALTGNKTIIQTNDSCALIATLTGIGVDGERIGVPGQTVTVYEEYTPALDITATPQIIQSGDNTSIILQLKDEEDGSLVRESGLTIDLYSNVAVFKSFTLTSDKDTLSYSDEESAVLTVTYLEDNVGVSGKSVVFKNGDTVLDTVVTDSNGEAEYTYASQGVGDVTITAECMGLQETYSIEDCILYDSLASVSGKWTIPSGVTSIYSSDGWKITASSYKQIKLTEKLTTACSVEFTVVDYSTPTSSYAPIIVYAYTNGETTPNQSILQNYSTYIEVLGTRLNQSLVKGAVYRIDYTSSTISVYENGTLLSTANNNVGFPTRFEWHMGANGRYAVYKNLKVKPL